MENIAWAAGFFDGEGNVSYARSYPSAKTGRVTAQLCAQIAQKGDNREVLEVFQHAVGFGKIYGPYPYKTPAGRREEKYVLVYNTDEVERLLIVLKPYLKSRKTSDFQLAILAYYAHDSHVNEADIRRVEKRMAKHPHKLILMDKKTWRCILPGCSFFVHLGLAHVLIGKLAICSKCGEQFTLNERALQDDMPQCNTCRIGVLDEMDIDTYMAEMKKRNQKPEEKDEIEVIEPDEAHSSECAIYTTGECDCK